MTGKTYSEFMDEISSSDLYEKLVSFGLFSEKLPPVFQSVDFFEYCVNIKKQRFSKEAHSYVVFYSNRNINTPRSLAIPNPMAHENLCKELAENWENITKHFNEKTFDLNYKVSRLHVRKSSSMDGLFLMNYKNWWTDGNPVQDLLIGSKYEVHCDISQCFPSIYTHAIPWALVTKSHAKKIRCKNKWFNKLDFRTSQTKNGETHGILIGPHTSNIISEIILTTIDKDLVNSGWKHIRFIDDYTCYVETREDAERFLVNINSILREYGLSLNHTKTKILELPYSDVEKWPNVLISSTIYYQKFKSFVDYNEIKRFFEICLIEMKKNEDNSAILLYGLKLIKKKNLTKNAKHYLLKKMVSLSLIYPYLVPLLNDYIFTPYNSFELEISKYINMIFKRYFKLNNYEACTFTIFSAISNDCKLIDLDIDEIIKKDDCVLLLMSLIYSRKYQLSENIEKLKSKAKIIHDTGEVDSYWVFVYEALNYAELSGEFKNIKKHEVSFLREQFRY